MLTNIFWIFRVYQVQATTTKKENNYFKEMKMFCKHFRNLSTTSHLTSPLTSTHSSIFFHFTSQLLYNNWSTQRKQERNHFNKSNRRRWIIPFEHLRFLSINWVRVSYCCMRRKKKFFCLSLLFTKIVRKKSLYAFTKIFSF